MKKENIYKFLLIGLFALISIAVPVATIISSAQLPENADNGSLLVIKDSYAHSLIPFLAKNYSHITVLDLRYINGDIETLGVNIGDYKNVLFMYNVITFSQDTNVKKLNFIFK